MGDDSHTPVVMFSYNRPDFVRMSVRNVALATGAGERDIFMYMDGPRCEADIVKQHEIVRILQEYQKQLPRLKIVCREKNLGCRENIVRAISEIIGVYGRVAVVEDDVLIARTFFKYVDSALTYYENDLNIWAVSAFVSPYLKIPSHCRDVLFTPLITFWGWATWANRWREVDFEMSTWCSDRLDAEMRKSLDCAGRDLIPMIEGQYCGRLKTWDVQCMYHVARRGLRCVIPRLSLAKNIGFRQGGEHFHRDIPFFSRQKYYNFMPVYDKYGKNDPYVEYQWEYLNASRNLADRIARKLKRELARFSPRNIDPISLV